MGCSVGCFVKSLEPCEPSDAPPTGAAVYSPLSLVQSVRALDELSRVEGRSPGSSATRGPPCASGAPTRPSDEPVPVSSRAMTSREKAIVQALIAVAWADGSVGGPEEGVVEGLLAGFDASDEEEAELLAWAKTERTLGDVNIAGLEEDDRELLLSNAALLVSADGTETDEERAVLNKLAAILHLDAEQAREIVRSTRGRAPNSKR